MKRIFTLLLITTAAVLALADPIAVTVTQLNQNPAQYHAKDVTVTGKVDRFQQKTSRAGNDYFTFNLTEPGKGKEIMSVRVYGMGKLDPPLKDGTMATVTGDFQKEHVVSGRTYKMEIDVKPKDIVTPKAGD